MPTLTWQWTIVFCVGLAVLGYLFASIPEYRDSVLTLITSLVSLVVGAKAGEVVTISSLRKTKQIP